MKIARRHFSSAVLNGCIYVAGGDNLWNPVESYNPKTNKWTQLAPMKGNHGSFTLAELNGYLYTLGDEYGIERFDPFANRWTQVCKLFNRR